MFVSSTYSLADLSGDGRHALRLDSQKEARALDRITQTASWARSYLEHHVYPMDLGSLL